MNEQKKTETAAKKTLELRMEKVRRMHVQSGVKAGTTLLCQGTGGGAYEPSFAC